jgi:hypothetical protein
MNIHYRYEDGTTVPDGVCLRPISSRTRLTVEIDSMGHISPDAIMNDLKKRWGVRSVVIEEEVITCKGFTKTQPVK